MGASHKGSNYEREKCSQLSRWASNGEADDWFYRTAGSGARSTVRRKVNIDTSNSAGDVGYLDEKGKWFIDFFLIELKNGYTANRRIPKDKIQEILDEYQDHIVNQFVAGKSEEDSKKEAYENLDRKEKRRILKTGGYEKWNPFAFDSRIATLFATTKKKSVAIDPLDFIDSKQAEPLLLAWWVKAEKERIQTQRPYSMVIFKRDGKADCVMISYSLYIDIQTFGIKNINPDDWFAGSTLKINLKDFNLVVCKLESFLSWCTPEMIQRIAFNKSKIAPSVRNMMIINALKQYSYANLERCPDFEDDPAPVEPVKIRTRPEIPSAIVSTKEGVKHAVPGKRRTLARKIKD